MSFLDSFNNASHALTAIKEKKMAESMTFYYKLKINELYSNASFLLKQLAFAEQTKTLYNLHQNRLTETQQQAAYLVETLSTKKIARIEENKEFIKKLAILSEALQELAISPLHSL